MDKVVNVAKAVLKTKRFWAAAGVLVGAVGGVSNPLVFQAVETVVCALLGGCVA